MANDTVPDYDLLPFKALKSSAAWKHLVVFSVQNSQKYTTVCSSGQKFCQDSLRIARGHCKAISDQSLGNLDEEGDTKHVYGSGYW